MLIKKLITLLYYLNNMTLSCIMESASLIHTFGEEFRDEYTPYMNRSYDLDGFQKRAATEFQKGNDVLVLAHTGRGKTVVMEETICHTLVEMHKKGKDGICVIPVPIKALANQHFRDFRKKLGKFSEEYRIKPKVEVMTHKEVESETGIEDVTRVVSSVGILTGDTQIGLDSNVIIMTTEILQQVLLGIRKRPKRDVELDESFEDKIKLVVFDEVHFFNDKHRGKVWETTILFLKPSVQMVMLSATLSHPEKFASWIVKHRRKPISLIATNHRAVPLTSYVLVDNKQIMVQDSKDTFLSSEWDRSIRELAKSKSERKHPRRIEETRINEAIAYMRDNDLLQANFFIFNQMKCEQYAMEMTVPLLEGKESAEAVNYFDQRIISYKNSLEDKFQYHKIRDLVAKGVAYHHAGLYEVLKNVVEELFLMGKIKVLFSTETFAVGINMPTRTAVFVSIAKRDQGGMRILHSHEFKQMAGRAGRRGYDDVGNVIILPVYELPSSLEVKHMFTGKVPEIKSQMQIDYSYILQMALTNKMSIQEALDSSLFSLQTRKSIIMEREMVAKELAELEKFKFEVSKDDKDVMKEYFEMVMEEEDMRQSYMTFSRKEEKARDKKRDKLKKKVCNFKDKYENFQEYFKKKSELKKQSKELDEWEGSAVEQIFYTAAILQDTGYINPDISELKDLKEDAVLEKGLIAAQINDCNPLLLTELIVAKEFNYLKPEEIFAVLSCFVAEKKITDPLELAGVHARVDLTPNIHYFLDRMNEHIKSIKAIEKKWGLDVQFDGLWNISYDYLQASLMWAKGCSFHEVLPFLPRDTEGHFVRTMIRTNNVVHDLSLMSETTRNIEILPYLEKIEEMVIRDFVKPSSLYLDS